MPCPAVALIAFRLLCSVASCVVAVPAIGATESCASAADLVERQLGLPHGLLASIGAVESGNRPWSVDGDGTGATFASAGDAVAFVRNGAEGARYVDVGCFQVDLAFHPDAFRSLEDAFDPVTNATAAGRYLISLRRSASSWSEAVARYHSGQVQRGRDYAARVYASLDGPEAPPEPGVTVAGVRVFVPSIFGAMSAHRRRADGRLGLPAVITP